MQNNNNGSSCSRSGNGLTDTNMESAAALKQAIREGHLVAYYTHPYQLPVGCGTTEQAQSQLPHGEAVAAPGDFSFLPFPAYCGLTTVDKVLYKHHLSHDVVS
ncbi:hypothetical protein DQ04_00101050 [Trypanosoma grayi]|uniref:hypothetical protein n=1 Tax=Trypanosoma grayi TaxID=71804 RepID=UPI0004F4B318|nr:hypothetical protein DQ04_00101050 [Trypanosoma grayi]KEG15338.1 hypothetical protein DQ04_00101050 [Trypanosoma grayi]